MQVLATLMATWLVRPLAISVAPMLYLISFLIVAFFLALKAKQLRRHLPLKVGTGGAVG